MQSLAVSGLGRVRMRADVNKLVAVRRASAQETALDLSLSCHRGADPDLDAIAFAFGDAAEDGHDQVVRFVVRVDRASNLGHPQLHAVVGEQREGVAELVAVERPLRLADNHCFKATVRVG
ncbi:MAG TPA: hypothetical protein VGM14_25055 [Streptosporangiaceae bacterium]